MVEKPPLWLEWAREIQAIAQIGLTFSENEFARERYKQLIEISAQIIQEHSNFEKDLLVNNFLSQPGYATPKIDVRGAVIQNNQILLVQERTDQCWCMPGGWADVGDSPSEMVAREVREESGFEVIPKKLIGVFDANRSGRPLELYHAYKMVFLCEIQGGSPTPSNETSAVNFFDFSQLPRLSRNRTNEVHLAEIQAHLKDPSRPTKFD